LDNAAVSDLIAAADAINATVNPVNGYQVAPVVLTDPEA